MSGKITPERLVSRETYMNTLNQNIVIFAPHPDDETLACGGTIILETLKGSRVHLVFMTDGRNSHTTTPDTFPKPSQEEVKKIRKSEALKAVEILGADKSNISFLDFYDGTLKNNLSNAKQTVEKHLSDIQPAEIYLPAFADVHRDHHSTNGIVLAVIRKLKLSLDLFEYVIWAGEEQLAEMLKMPNLVTNDIPAVIPQKLRAIVCYQSQVGSSLNGRMQIPVLNETFLARFKLPVEHFWKYRVTEGKVSPV